MKKLLSIVSIFFIALTATMLTSCTNDDDNDKKITEHVISFRCVPNDVLLEVANLTVTYTDANGNTHTEALEGAFNKTVTVTKFPAQGLFKVQATMKEKFDGAAVSGKTPELSYTYVVDNTTTPGSFQKLFAYTESDIEELLAKINAKTWTWSILSSGTIAHN